MGSQVLHTWYTTETSKAATTTQPPYSYTGRAGWLYLHRVKHLTEWLTSKELAEGCSIGRALA